MRICEQTDFRAVLRWELEKRHARNPRYSIRSFARDLSMAPSRLYEVLNGRYGLSRSSAGSAAEKMRLGDEENAHFCDLVEAAHGRSRLSRASAQARIQERQLSQKDQEQIFTLKKGVAAEGLMAEIAKWIVEASRSGGEIELRVRRLDQAPASAPDPSLSNSHPILSAMRPN